MLMTNHAAIYRIDRLNWIIDTFGVEEPCMALPSRMEGYTMRICESGATFITADDTGELITAYMITPEMAKVTFRKAHTPLSDNLIKRITKNYKQYCEFEKARK